jgi:hypothetical protein
VWIERNGHVKYYPIFLSAQVEKETYTFSSMHESGDSPFSGKRNALNTDWKLP